MIDTLHLEIKNMLHNKRYGNLAVDSAAKFFFMRNLAADSTAKFFFHSGGAWAERPQAAPPE